jgi:hypothetical protein
MRATTRHTRSISEASSDAGEPRFGGGDRLEITSTDPQVAAVAIVPGFFRTGLLNSEARSL